MLATIQTACLPGQLAPLAESPLCCGVLGKDLQLESDLGIFWRIKLKIATYKRPANTHQTTPNLRCHQTISELRCHQTISG